jgi:hypothetical protein
MTALRAGRRKTRRQRLDGAMEDSRSAVVAGADSGSSGVVRKVLDDMERPIW